MTEPTAAELQSQLTFIGDRLAEIVLASLESAASRLPLEVPGFDHALRTCSQIVVHGTRSWFFDEMTRIVELKVLDTTGELRWTQLHRHAIARAATVQIPAQASQENRALWDRVLQMPELAEYAIVALGQDPAGQLALLGTWWELDHPNRTELLESMLHRAAKNLRGDAFKHCLQHEGGKWPKPLRMEVNTILKRLNGTPVFPPDDEAAPSQ